MSWVVLVTSLTFAIWIPGQYAYIPGVYNSRYPECDGTRPWPVEGLSNGATVIFISREIDGHLKRFQDELGRAYDDTRLLEYLVKLMYTNSTIETDWTKISGVSQQQAEACRNLFLEFTRERLKLIIEQKYLECNIFERQHSKTKDIFLAWEGRNRWNDSSDALAQAKGAYENICNESGTATGQLMDINQIFESIEQRDLDPAKECYKLVEEQPQKDMNKKQGTS